MTVFPFDAAIFDVDGTLALTATLHFDAFNAAARRQGAQMTRAWYDSRKGLDRRGLTTALAQLHLRETGRALDTGALMAESLALTIECAASVAVENPPVAAFARCLHGHVRLGVGSNAETPVVEAVLAGAGLAALFDAMVTVSDTGRAKPAPDIFTLAASRLGIAPDRCLVLEDSDEGLEAARRAGMTGWDIRDPQILRRMEAFGR
ncbi:MAG: HAD family phosphatase [Maritimibacter sp.]|nr:HAD family phosphatase [Maritimibacter sp.]